MRPAGTEARRAAAGARGGALVSVLVTGVVLFGLVYSTSLLSVVEVKDARAAIDDVRARQLAETGVERAFLVMGGAVRANPFDPIRTLAKLFDGGPTMTAFVGEPLVDGGAEAGAFSATITMLEDTGDAITVRIDATGYVPAAPPDLPPGRALRSWHAISVETRYALEPSRVFDFAYFINNWGWFYGSSIVCNGNAGANGQFDAAGYAPTVTGQPTYEGVDWSGGTARLIGYRDDNGDGLADGRDGGIFAGWDIVGTQNVRGNGGTAANQHDFQDPIEMPNLNDLSLYEERAASAGGGISIGGVQVSDAVYGDGPGERQNLYLHGTASEPIVIDGPVVVRGDVVISGYVTGQGTIYAGRNVYVPKSVSYLDGPSTPRPPGTTASETEAWLTDNWEKDFLGLFARENVVVGDYTKNIWKHYVSQWMNSPMNESAEDSGEDRIPNTRAGRDGILGTADDDVLEGDGVFTVEHYTEADEAMGLIPDGFSVGDAIPGSGEDIDGDGQYDPRITLSDLFLQVPLHPDHFGGNIPPSGIPSYDHIASLQANRLDAVFYTNHTFAWLVLGNQNATLNGALVSRNEDVIYGTPRLVLNYDCRLLGGATGLAGDLLPWTVAPPPILRWQTLDADPNHYLAAP